jgi:hypothetical protein
MAVTLILMTLDGNVELYYDNSKKFETKSDGIDVTGEVQCDSLDVDGGADIAGDVNFHNSVSLQDSDKLFFGAGDDLQIYHDGSNSFIQEHGTGSLYIDANQLYLRNADTDNTLLETTSAGAVQVKHNGTTKLETTSSGVTVSGVIVDRLGGDIRRAIQNTRSSAYTLVETDTGKHVYISSGGVTVPNGVFAAGAMVTIVNNSGSDQTITQGSSMTMYNTSDASTGNRTLAGRGVCTILFVSGSQSYISGGGLS